MFIVCQVAHPLLKVIDTNQISGLMLRLGSRDEDARRMLDSGDDEIWGNIEWLLNQLKQTLPASDDLSPVQEQNLQAIHETAEKMVNSGRYKKDMSNDDFFNVYSNAFDMSGIMGDERNM